jgi:hypothetical protein
MTLTNNIIQLWQPVPRNAPGTPYELGSLAYPNAGDPVVCCGVEVGVVDSVCMDETIITYHKLYYCDVEASKTYEVRLTRPPIFVHDSIGVYDDDQNSSAWYLVHPSRLGRTKQEAVYRARDAIDTAIHEKEEDLWTLQSELSALRELQAAGERGA